MVTIGKWIKIIMDVVEEMICDMYLWSEGWVILYW